MAVKYFSDFKDDNGADWHVVIIDSTYGGSSPLEFTVGADGFVLHYEGSDTNRSQAIIPSTLEFSYYIQNGNDDQLLSDIAGSAEGRYSVEIYSGGASYSAGHLYWRGTLLSDISDFVDEYYPQEFRLTAIDDLASLKNLPYETATTGYVNLPALVSGMLNKMRVWDLTTDTHRATLVSWLEARDTGGTWRDIWTHGQLNMVSFNNSDTVPTTYRDAYESLEGILSGLGCRLYWRASIDAAVNSSFVIDSLTAQQYDTDLLTGYTVSSSGATASTTLTRQEINLDSSEIKRLQGWRKGYLNPLARVERQFTYGSNPFVVDHEYSGTPDSNNFHNGSYDAGLDPAPSVQYQEGSRISLRFRMVSTHAAANTGIIAFNTVAKRAGRFKITADFRVGQYYANRDVDPLGTTNHWIAADGAYCPVCTYTEQAAGWSTSAIGSSLEWYTPVVTWSEEQSQTFDLGIDLPPLPADLTSEICTLSFAITPVDADGLQATYVANIGDLFNDNPPQILKVTMYPTDIFELSGSNITFKVDNSNAGAREVLTLPNIYFSDKLGAAGGGLYLLVASTRSQPSDWQSPNNLALDENLHNIVAKEWLAGQAETLKKMSGDVRDFRTAPDNAISLLDTITHETVNYGIQRLEFTAARGLYQLNLLELRNSGTHIIEPATFSDGFDNPVLDNGRPDVSPSTDVVVGEVIEKTDLIQITQTVNLDDLEQSVSNIETVLKSATGGGGIGVYTESDKSTTGSYVGLTTTSAHMQAGGGNTAIDLTESSPGEITLSVQVGPTGLETSTTAIQIQGTTGSQLPNIVFQANISGIEIGDLDDVTTTGVQTNQVLAWNGTNFVPVNQSGGGGAADTTELELKTIFLEQ